MPPVAHCSFFRVWAEHSTSFYFSCVAPSVAMLLKVYLAVFFYKKMSILQLVTLNLHHALYSFLWCKKRPLFRHFTSVGVTFDRNRKNMVRREQLLLPHTQVHMTMRVTPESLCRSWKFMIQCVRKWVLQLRPRLKNGSERDSRRSDQSEDRSKKQ